jgi:hypothetical protein
MTGGDLNATGGALEGMRALRKIGTEDGLDFDKLVVAHVSKGSADGPLARQTIFGSQFFTAMARNVWLVARDSEEGLPHIDQLYHQAKNNSDMRERDFSLRLLFNKEQRSVRLQYREVADSAEFEAQQPLRRRLIELVRRAGGQLPNNPKAIWLQLAHTDPTLKEQSVRNTLHKTLQADPPQLILVGDFLCLPAPTPLQAVVGLHTPVQPAAYPADRDDDEGLPWNAQE